MKRALAALLVCLLAGSAGAASIYATPAPMTGSRTVADPGLTTAEADWADATIDWAIDDNGDGTYTYTYTFTNFDKPGISHITLDLTDNAVDDPDAITAFEFNGSPSGDLEIGDKDGITGAVKFDIGADGDLVYSFISNRSPVFGDIHVKGGQSVLTNTGFGDHSSETRIADDFIARPDGVVPEPATLGLLVIGGVVLIRRKRR